MRTSKLSMVVARACSHLLTEKNSPIIIINLIKLFV
jgi:hypothetical protein